MIIKHKRRTPERRNKINDPRYNTSQWKNTRKHVLVRDEFLCQCDECKKLPVAKIANVVDHIKSVTRGGEFWMLENLQAMNESCHQRKSQSEVRR